MIRAGQQLWYLLFNTPSDSGVAPRRTAHTTNTRPLLPFSVVPRSKIKSLLTSSSRISPPISILGPDMEILTSLTWVHSKRPPLRLFHLIHPLALHNPLWFLHSVRRSVRKDRGYNCPPCKEKKSRRHQMPWSTFSPLLRKFTMKCDLTSTRDLCSWSLTATSTLGIT